MNNSRAPPPLGNNTTATQAPQPNVVSYNAILSAPNMHGRQALRLLRKIQRDRSNSSNIQPNDITYKSVLEACVRSRCYSDALHLLPKVCGKTVTRPSMRADSSALFWDLHNLSLATSCMLVSAALLAVVQPSQRPRRWKFDWPRRRGCSPTITNPPVPQCGDHYGSRFAQSSHQGPRAQGGCTQLFARHVRSSGGR